MFKLYVLVFNIKILEYVAIVECFIKIGSI